MKAASIRFLLILHSLYLVQVFGSDDKDAVKESEETQSVGINLPSDHDEVKENNLILARSFFKLGQPRQSQGSQIGPGLPPGTGFGTGLAPGTGMGAGLAPGSGWGGGFAPGTGLGAQGTWQMFSGLPGSPPSMIAGQVNAPSSPSGLGLVNGVDLSPQFPYLQQQFSSSSNFGGLPGPGFPSIPTGSDSSGSSNIMGTTGIQGGAPSWGSEQLEQLGTGDNGIGLIPGDSQDSMIDYLIRSRVADLQRFVLEINKFTQLISSVALGFVSKTNMFGEVERKPFFDPENLENMKVLVDLFRNVKNQASNILANILNDFTFILNYLSAQPLFGVPFLATELSRGLYSRLSSLPALFMRRLLNRRH